jgi:hypothetical protein
MAAVFGGHHPFDLLEQGAGHPAGLERLSAVLDREAFLSADELVVGALVGVLEPAPTADVLDEDGLEVGRSADDVGQQLLQAPAARGRQAADAGVDIGPDDHEPMTFGEGA